MSSQNNQDQPDNMADDPLSNQDKSDQISLPEEIPEDSNPEDFNDDNAPVVDSGQADAQKDVDFDEQEEDQSQPDEVCDNDAPSKEDIEESKNEVDALLSEDQDDLLGSAIDPEEALGEEGAEEMLVEEEEEAVTVIATKSADKLKPISDKFFYKEMARIKEKSKTTGIGTLPPKKSASAYIIFQKEKRPEILQKNPKAKVTEVVKEIARCWSLLSKDDRMIYKVQAKRDKERYERELKTLEDQSSTIKKPKKCLSAYMIFVQETRPKIVTANPDMGALMVMKEVGRAWQAMVETDRKYFKDKADNDKHRYLAESRRFYDEVSRIGEQNNQDKKAALANSKAKVQIKSRQDQENSKASDEGENNEVLAGKKRPANTKASKLLNRSSSFSKRGANQVMSIGLAPEEGRFESPQDIAAQKRMRAESRFTFKPDNNQSDEQVLSEKDDDFENEDQDASDDGLYEELFGEDGPPETAIQFFAKEFVLSIRKDFYELQNSVQNKAIKKRWDELTPKQQQPFMTLARTEAEKREDLTKKDASGSAARRNAKCSLKIKTSIPVSTVACLNRTSQRIAKEALSLPKEFKDELKASLERQKNASMQQPSNQLDNQQGFEDGNQNKALELSEMGAPAGSGLFDMDSIGLAKNMWSGSTMQRNQSGLQNGSNIQAQNQLNAQVQQALQNGYLNLLGNSLNLQQNGPNQLSLAQQQQLLLGQQNQNESDYFGLQNSSTGLSNDFLQQQILQQQLGGLNQQQYTNNLMSILLAQQNMQGNNLLLNQQALQQQMQQPNQQNLLNQQNIFNLLQQQKLAQSLGGSGGGQFGGFDFLGGGSNQLNNFYGGMHKTQETPQFAGMTHDSLIGGDELAFQSLPTAATQPIANIFYPTSTALEEPINFSHLLNSGINPAQATPVTNAALGNMQNSMFLQDFQLPASASSPFQNLNDVGANTKPMFGQDNKTQQNGANQLNHSPQISPQIGPLAHNNDHSQNPDQPQNLLMWQQNPLSSRNSVQKIGSSNNMLGNVLGQSNKNFMHQQSTPTSVTFMNPLKDQLAMNNSSAQSYLGNQSTPNLNLAQTTSHTDQQYNSTSVTPFLKPTARQSDHQTNQQGALQSPFMKALQHPGANGGGNIPSAHSYASMLGLPGVANNTSNTNGGGISPILGAQSHNANMSLQHQQQLGNALQGNNTPNGAGSAASMTPLQNQTFGNQATGQNSSFLAQSMNASRDT